MSDQQPHDDQTPQDDRTPQDDLDIHQRITELVTHQHELRAAVAAGTLAPTEERAQVKATEEALDQAWDLLRQRQARRDAAQDPAGTGTRPVGEVEGYQQ